MLTPIPLEQLRLMIAETVTCELSRHLEQAAITKINDELITRKEAAALLGISLPTLLEFTKTGKVTGYRIGTRVRYKRTEIIDSLKQIQVAKYLRRLQ
ncbi:helix-turn-helix domain-containing protein [Chitinophaga dinghuensis]|uniref:helix-turn-helix domain-containing protein n=1 Tax=Chitinophaga dinghuensis TaxID=1539050 RepID=UPI001B868551|nr:helix-turn-helix domain-containing protein [Chitinophaga dinghuensis]